MISSKKKNWSNLECHEYWMGMAFMLAARSKFGNASLLVDNSSKMICYGLQTLPPVTTIAQVTIPSEVAAILEYDRSIPSVTMYSTSAPTYEGAVMIAACPNIKSVFYFPRIEADSKVSDLLKSVYCDLEPYECNLNWIRDYFMTVEHK